MPHFLWTQKQDIGPQPRFGHAMTYDAERKRVLLFGGATAGGLEGNTWEWDGSYWTQVADSGPCPRQEFALAYDTMRRRAVLFGGMADNKLLSGDTWEWDGQNWTQIQDIGPTPRHGHAMAYDSVRSRVVLYGGLSANGPQRDTWRWDGDDWTQEEDTGPAPRQGHALAYDGPRKRLVLFGGRSDEGVFGDTWVYDGVQWTQVADTGPAPCFESAMVCAFDQITLFGGAPALDPNFAENPALQPLFGKTWQLDSTHWTEWQDIGPAPRKLHAMAYDSDRRRIVLFGGLSVFGDIEQPAPPATILGETWEHEVTTAPGQPVTTGIIASLVLNPKSVNRGGFFGNDTLINYTVTLSGPRQVPTDVQFTTDIPNSTPVPKQPLIPAGRTVSQGSFSINANLFTASGTYRIAATAEGSSAFATFTLT